MENPGLVSARVHYKQKLGHVLGLESPPQVGPLFGGCKVQDHGNSQEITKSFGVNRKSLKITKSYGKQGDLPMPVIAGTG